MGTKTTKILIINAAGYMGGDIAMLLLGLPYLGPDQFSIFSISIPRGKVYETIRALPNATVMPMELGGKELAIPSRSSKGRRAMNASLAIARSLTLIWQKKIDVIYTFDRTAGMALSYIVSRLTGCPLVLNAQIWHYLETSSIHRRVIRHASRITVSSNEMRQKFIPFVKDPQRLKVIPNAIRVSNYDPHISGEGIRKEFNIDPGDPVVVLAGRLTPYKGQAEFIRAAGLVLKERPDVHFLIAGTENIPGYQAILEQLIAEQNLGNCVKLIGYREDIPQVFASADIVAMPSHEEAFGLVALEGMAMEKPVVATRAGGVPEFLVDGEMGYLIPPKDVPALAQAILKLINNPEMAREMGCHGRQQVEASYNDRLYGVQIARLFSELNHSHPSGKDTDRR